MTKVSGACLCGAVQYECAAEPAMTAICHCENCQKQTGTSFSLIVAVPEDAVTIENDETLKTFNDAGESGQAVRRRFCGACGSPIMSLVASVPGMAFIKAGTLHDRSWLKPTMHIWCDTAQPWYAIPEEAQQIARNP